MSINLIKTIQENLGLPALRKIDPNTGKPEKNTSDIADNNAIEQAAIPAVVTGFYKFVQSDKGAEDFLQANKTTNWVDKIFSEHENDVVEAVANYAHQSNRDTTSLLNRVATETVRVVHAQLSLNADIKEVKTFFSNQRIDILVYLPNELRMGELLYDNTLDDNTNKMEGPVSNLIKNIGSAFSNPVTGDKMKEN